MSKSTPPWTQTKEALNLENVSQTTSLCVREKKLGKSLDKEGKGCTRKAGRKNKWDSKVAAAYARDSRHIKIDRRRGRELVEEVLIRMTDKQKANQATVGDMPIDFVNLKICWPLSHKCARAYMCACQSMKHITSLERRPNKHSYLTS